MISKARTEPHHYAERRCSARCPAIIADRDRSVENYLSTAGDPPYPPPRGRSRSPRSRGNRRQFPTTPPSRTRTTTPSGKLTPRATITQPSSPPTTQTVDQTDDSGETEERDDRDLASLHIRELRHAVEALPGFMLALRLLFHSLEPCGARSGVAVRIGWGSVRELHGDVDDDA